MVSESFQVSIHFIIKLAAM